MKDGRWVHMAIEDPYHSLPANPQDLIDKEIITQHVWPMLNHVVSVEVDGPSGRQQVQTLIGWNPMSPNDL